MNVLIESEHTLVVEDKGRKMLTLAMMVLLPIMLIHLTYLVFELRSLQKVSSGVWGWIAIFVALVIYGTLFYLLTGPMRDIMTVTFHGVKSIVTIERTYPFSLSNSETIPFTEIDQFEIASPESGGLVQIRKKDGNSIMLFRVRNDEELKVARRIDVITKKKTVVG